MEAEARQVTESERSAVEAALLSRFGGQKPLADGRGGASPYAPHDVVYGPAECRARGTRVALVAVCSSRTSGYKGRGRTRTVYAVAPAAGGPLAVCHPSDRDAQEVGVSGYFTRPWATHQAEIDSAGLGLGASAMSDAFAALGLEALPPPPPVVVTRHPGLVEVLREQGLIPAGVRVIAHASAEDVRGLDVYGVLPLALAAEAASVTEVTLTLPAELRGQELSADQVRAHMTGVTRYVVRRVE